MAKEFKVGDRLLCIRSVGRLVVGQEYIVAEGSNLGYYRVEGVSGHWLTSRFEEARPFWLTLKEKDNG